MKNLKELSGIKNLTKREQRLITGGLACRTGDNYCPGTSFCCLEGDFIGLCRPQGRSCYA
jgi:hypothetical protein